MQLTFEQSTNKTDWDVTVHHDERFRRGIIDKVSNYINDPVGTLKANWHTDVAATVVSMFIPTPDLHNMDDWGDNCTKGKLREIRTIICK